MKLYHGTTVSHIKVLHSNSKDGCHEPVLYLTDNRPYSLFYIRDRDIDFVTCGVGEDGKVYYDEKFPNQLQILYDRLSGYVYETDTSAQKHRTRGIWLCSGNVKVTDAEYIPNVYQAILSEIEKGNVVLRSYDTLTEEQKQMNHQGILHHLRHGARSPQKELFYQKYFPEAWEEYQNECHNLT